MNLVIDTAGILVLWFGGLAVAFYAPFFAAMMLARTDGGLSAIIIGFFWGKVFAITYLAASIAYLAAT
tara:strand:- start:283 stop:486 length:204 start_codon:yes stop_codon:yes gene_type:complete